MFDAASQYVARGYAVVLLHGAQGAGCTCFRGPRCTSPGKHPVARNWTKRGARTVEELSAQWDARNGRSTNIGILLDSASRLLLIDVDVKKGKKGPETLAEWSRATGVNLDNYLVQFTPSGGQHHLVRIPKDVDPSTLPNGTDVGPGVDVLRDGRQFVVSPSRTPAGDYYHPLDTLVVLPPIEALPEAPVVVLEYLQSLRGAKANPRSPVSDLTSLEAPSMERLREVVSHIPNDETVPRPKWVWMAYRILAAGGRQNEVQSREIFLDWAAKYPGANREKDERVFDTLDWKRVRGGWPDLWRLAAKNGYDASRERDSGAPKGSAVDQLVREILANKDIEVFRGTKDGRPYVRARLEGQWHTHALDSSSGVDLLRHVKSLGGRSPSSQTLSNAVDLLRSHARYTAIARDVFLRVARVDSAIYIDLGDESFRAIEVTATGWRVVQEAPVLFVRRQGMRRLSQPISGASVKDFRAYFSTCSDDDLRLLITFLVDVFVAPSGTARPILILDGPPGSAKTTMTRFCKNLTDPQVGGVFALPQNARDLVIAAQSNHVVALDNASTIPAATSDALCRLTAGGGLRTRKLYTDEDETVFDDLRHVILNSVGDVAKQNDLRDRAMFVFTRRLEERRDDEELETSFKAASGKLLGVLLDAAVAALANAGTVRIQPSQLPRMAGFATRGAACATALGWSAQQFLSAYRENVDRAAADYLDDDIVSNAVLKQSWRGARAWYKHRLEANGEPDERVASSVAPERWDDLTVWKGPASHLQAYLEEQVPGTAYKKAWPRDVRYFGQRLKMAGGALRAAGWQLDYERRGLERLVIIRRISGWQGAPPDLDTNPSPLEGSVP